MLKIDRYEEEQKRLGMEADGMCAWFGRELATVTIVLYSPDNFHAYRAGKNAKDAQLQVRKYGSRQYKSHRHAPMRDPTEG